jgi:hypothetical protein
VQPLSLLLLVAMLTSVDNSNECNSDKSQRLLTIVDRVCCHKEWQQAGRSTPDAACAANSTVAYELLITLAHKLNEAEAVAQYVCLLYLLCMLLFQYRYVYMRLPGTLSATTVTGPVLYSVQCRPVPQHCRHAEHVKAATSNMCVTCNM